MNPISQELNLGTIGELLVQIRLLQYGVQAAPPIKDSGNDLIAIRGSAMQALQVKTTRGKSFRKPSKKLNHNKTKKTKIQYNILATVHIVGDGQEIKLDECDVYLIKKVELAGLSCKFSNISDLKLSSERIDKLFPQPQLEET